MTRRLVLKISILMFLLTMVLWLFAYLTRPKAQAHPCWDEQRKEYRECE